MHELAVTENLISIVVTKATEAKATRITKINLIIGELSGFVPDCIRFYFDSLKKDEIIREATLHFQVVPARLRCRDCSAVFSPKNAVWSCPECQSQRVELSAGREFYIESIEVE